MEEGNKKGGDIDNAVSDDREAAEAKFPPLPSNNMKSVYHVNPLGMRVLVRIPKDQNMTEGGLYLPEGAKALMEESVIAEVIEVASAVDDHSEEETNVSGVPLGANVLISRKAGVRIPWDDELRIVDTKEVLAMVEKMTLS